MGFTIVGRVPASLDARVCSCMAPPSACRSDRRSARDVPRIQKSRQAAECPFRSGNWVWDRAHLAVTECPRSVRECVADNGYCRGARHPQHTCEVHLRDPCVPCVPCVSRLPLKFLKRRERTGRPRRASDTEKDHCGRPHSAQAGVFPPGYPTSKSP